MTEKMENKQENMNSDSIHLAISSSELARNTFLYGLAFGYLEMKISEHVVFEQEDCFLLLFVANGSGSLTHGNQKHLLEKDSLLFMECKKKHHIHSTLDLDILYLYFNGNQAKAYYDMIFRYKLTLTTILNSKTIRSLFWQIISLHRKSNKHAEHLTSLHITRIITEISMLSDNQIISDVEFPEYINNIFHRIGHFYKEKFTLDELANLYSVSKFHLAREFKRCAGTTINEYLVATRINHAKSLLRFSEKSVEEIAEEVGFYNASHFIKMFRRYESVTPLYYRKQWTR